MSQGEESPVFSESNISATNCNPIIIPPLQCLELFNLSGLRHRGRLPFAIIMNRHDVRRIDPLVSEYIELTLHTGYHAPVFR